MGPLERRVFRTMREQLLRHAKGSVLEIGSGTGANFRYYRLADRVVAVEPDLSMITQSKSRAEQADVPVELVRANAERLPFPADSFDTVVGTLVFCTIPDPLAALNDIRRVCKPGGTLLLIEHVRMERPLLGKLQDWITPAWKRLCGGCHLNRDTIAAVEQAGFRITNRHSPYRGLIQIVAADNGK